MEVKSSSKMCENLHHTIWCHIPKNWVSVVIICIIYQLNVHTQLNIYYFISNLSYMFRHILHHPQGTLVTCSGLLTVMLLH